MPLICAEESILRPRIPVPRRHDSAHSEDLSPTHKTSLIGMSMQHKQLGLMDASESVANLRDTLDRTLSSSSSPPTALPDLPVFDRIRTNMPPPQRKGSAGRVLSDTPLPTAPTSPSILPMRTTSGTSTPRARTTTLDIPGLTKSKVSPDGRIASRDVGSKLIIVMVGLPARGKSYITKKLARYLNWLQHDTKIFNVGERRRVAASGSGARDRSRSQPNNARSPPGLPALGPPALPTRIMLNGDQTLSPPGTPDVNGHVNVGSASHVSMSADEEVDHHARSHISAHDAADGEYFDQSADFFDPSNTRAAQLREQCALDTLDELLDYILDGNGSVGILDATNSTLERRKLVMNKIRARAGPALNVLFLESRCVNKDLLEANMMLKLSGPDYKDQDPAVALADFKRRVAIYEKNYIPLGDYEENSDMPYIQMIDVGRKIISHQIKGFLMAQANYYLLNFNLAPRQIWITRHGLSVDNILGKIGGDSDLSHEGERFARTLNKFMKFQRRRWDDRVKHKQQHIHFPPEPGDATPPNPHYTPENEEQPQKAFCVWTSMMKRSYQTGKFFDEDEYDVKQMRMLDELNAGQMEGLTYESIERDHPEEFRLRKKDKLHYRYPGPGGEGYLDIINRLRPVIVELERMTDHVLLVGHRSVARVLLAYFRGLKREDVADLDVPIGMLYCLEPKPYGVEFVAYQWDKDTEWFYEKPGYELRKAPNDMQSC